jgi:hypothetical protein
MPILSCSHDAYALFSEEFNGKKKRVQKTKKFLWHHTFIHEAYD